MSLFGASWSLIHYLPLATTVVAAVFVAVLVRRSACVWSRRN
jgi:hypothetical protein